MLPTNTEVTESARLGRHALEAPIGGTALGDVDARDDGDGGVSITVSLADPTGIYPWGIYDQDRCEPPAMNHEAPWQFPDIEGGNHTERVERSAYLSFPGRLVALVFSTDGSGLLACADLGRPAIVATESPMRACGSSGRASQAPIVSRPQLVVSADLLANADIYLMNDDGSDRIRLTDTLGLDIDPSWSPDGSQIAFRSTRDGQDEIYIMSADGSCQRDLTNSPADDRSPAWSPDGARIAFDHFFDDGYQDIAAINVDGSGLRRLTDDQGEYPAWSPDGSEIAFASVRDGDYDIYVMNADGTDQRAITHNATYDMYPAWSPDGRQIVYECEATPSAGFLGAAADICLMQRTGDQIRNITADAASNRFPAWSAAGMLAWSRGGSIQVASPVDGHPLDIGPGTFPDWRP